MLAFWCQNDNLHPGKCHQNDDIFISAFVNVIHRDPKFSSVDTFQWRLSQQPIYCLVVFLLKPILRTYKGLHWNRNVTLTKSFITGGQLASDENFVNMTIPFQRMLTLCETMASKAIWHLQWTGRSRLYIIMLHQGSTLIFFSRLSCRTTR